MGNMFWQAESFNADATSWDVSKVKDVGWMFQGAILFNQDISLWDVSNVRHCACMFEATSFNADFAPCFY